MTSYPVGNETSLSRKPCIPDEKLLRIRHENSPAAPPSLFVCFLLNGTSALFRPLVPRIVEIEHMIDVKNDLK